jgi:hypothetical protein
LPSYFWYWIVAASVVEGIAPGDALHGQPRAFHGPVVLNGLDAISGTVRLEPAHLKLAHRPKDDLVNSNSEDKKGFHFQLIRQMSVSGQNQPSYMVP